MMVKNIVRRNSYADSVFLMSLANRAGQLPGIVAASALMGTPENKRLLRDAGLLDAGGEEARPDDLIIALRAEAPESLEAAVERIGEWMTQRLSSAPAGEERPPRTLGSALDRLPDAGVVLISVPGAHVFWEARTALQAGRHVMIFSDHVPLDHEVTLKEMAAERGLMVMGPDCGTTILGGRVLGFGNVVRPGSIGIAGASGTGIQEVCSLLDRFDEGISHAIGLGGRDLSQQVGAASALQAVGLLAADPETDIIVVVSKPPDRAAAQRVLSALSSLDKPSVVCFQGSQEADRPSRQVFQTSGLEDAVWRVLRFRGRGQDVLRYFTKMAQESHSRAQEEMAQLKDEQRYIRGLFSGGSLCAEAGVLLRTSLPELNTNIGLPGGQGLENAFVSRDHALVDLGADEFTAGVPHPMIDFTVRNRRLIQEAEDPQTAVILFDIVLGYGAHPDPAGAILPAVLEARRIAEKRGGALCCVASVCGTRGDPQGLDRQCQMLQENGIMVFPSAAQAARFAVRVALRQKGEGLKTWPPHDLDDLDRTAEATRGESPSWPQGHLLQKPLKVINLGLTWFADSLDQQNVPVLQVDWRPPARGDKRLLEVLRKLQ
jgi:FdrA protein